MTKDNLKKLPGLKENVSLSDHTTFKIGGDAKYFILARSQQEIIAAIKFAKQSKLPFFILGQGSNVLVADDGYSGLIIKLQNTDNKVQDKINVYAEAGTVLMTAVDLAQKNVLTGFEWAAGIPGTVGAAVYGNVGAFGSTMADIIKSVRALDVKTLKIKNYSVKDCKFNNKESIFKKNRNLIILSAVFKLKKGDRGEIESEIKRFLEYRRKNHPLDCPSAGCIFKNYDKKIKDSVLLKRFPEIIEFNKGSRIPTSYLIDKSGLKGKVVGNVKVSEKHANFIVNQGGGKAADVIKLIKAIKKRVKEKFKIKLQEEVQYLGFK